MNVYPCRHRRDVRCLTVHYQFGMSKGILMTTLWASATGCWFHRAAAESQTRSRAETHNPESTTHSAALCCLLLMSLTWHCQSSTEHKTFRSMYAPCERTFCTEAEAIVANTSCQRAEQSCRVLFDGACLLLPATVASLATRRKARHCCVRLQQCANAQLIGGERDCCCGCRLHDAWKRTLVQTPHTCRACSTLILRCTETSQTD